MTASPITLPYVRVFADDSGRCCLEDRELTLDLELSAPPAEPLPMASVSAAFGRPTDVMLLRGDAGWSGGEPHVVPFRSLWGILVGEFEVTVSGGISRRFSPGDLVLVEDTAGEGHSSRILTDGLALVVRLD